MLDFLKNLGAGIESFVGAQMWSSIKGALIAFFGVLLLAGIEKVAPGTVPADTKTMLMLAAVTTIVNTVKQYVMPNTPTK